MDDTSNVNSGYTATDAVNDLNHALQPYLERSFSRRDSKDAQKYQRDLMHEQMTYQQANMERAYAQTSVASQMAQFRNAGLDPLAFLQYQRQQGIAPSAPSGVSAPQSQPFNGSVAVSEIARRHHERRMDSLDSLMRLKEMRLTDSQRNKVDAEIDGLLQSMVNDTRRVDLEDLSYSLQLEDMHQKYAMEADRLAQEENNLIRQLNHAKYMQNEEHVNQMESDARSFYYQTARDDAQRKFERQNSLYEGFQSDYNDARNKRYDSYWKEKENEYQRQLEEIRFRHALVEGTVKTIESIGSAYIGGKVIGKGLNSSKPRSNMYDLPLYNGESWRNMQWNKYHPESPRYISTEVGLKYVPKK